MTREEAVKTLQELLRETNDSWYEETYKMAIEALQDDWIPFNDDSAVPNYEVMCQDRHENMMLGYAWVDNYGIWMCEDDNTIMDDVVAWRPLPKPYKESEQ